MKPVDIIAAGHLCLDLIPDMLHVRLENLAIPGKLYETGPIRISTGGSVSNTGLALHRLGVSVSLMSIVGEDLIGQVILNYLAARDPALTEAITVNSGQPSSSTLVLSPHDTDRTFMHCAGTNTSFSSADIDFKRVEQAKLFHLGYPPLLPALIDHDGDELALIFQKAKAAGAVTSMDMVVPDPNAHSGQVNWPVILRKTLPYVDIFLPSIEEILFMLRRADHDAWSPNVLPYLNRHYLHDFADELLALGSVIVGFKLGEMGLYLRTGSTDALERLNRLKLDTPAWTDVELWSPAFLVEVAGTTGAGDSAYAGFLASLLRRLRPDEAIRWACAVGACNVEATDSTSGVRTWEETAARLAAGWPARPERLPGYSKNEYM
jgi:sugar/nucleoside kinase (ribokinase family)